MDSVGGERKYTNRVVTGRLALTKKFQQDSILGQMFGKTKMHKLDMRNINLSSQMIQAKETFSIID